MASYANFQGANKKYSPKNYDTNDNNVAFNSNVKLKTDKTQSSLENNLGKYIKFISWARW